jgi:hypothetical protein
MIVEKAGLHVTGDNEVLGWVAVGTDIDLQEGDVVITHHKTAVKHGLGEEFATEKAANKPTKVTGDRTRKAIPTTGTYTVLNADFRACNTQDVRGEVYRFIRDNNRIEAFYEKYPKGYVFVGARDGKEKTCSAKECIRYAITRGMIEVAA